VCLVVDTVEPDCGTEKLVSALAAQFDRSRIEPHLCCFEDGPRLAALAGDLQTAVFPLENVNSPAGLRQAWRFRRYAVKHRIDAVHSFMTRADIFGVLSTLGLRIPAVVTSRLNSGHWYTPKYLRLFRVLNRYTTHVVTNSAHAKKVISEAEKLAAGKITVFYPGVDLAKFSPSSGDASAAGAMGIPQDAKVVGIVANYREVKDLPLFLEAARIAAGAVPEAAFLLVGSGPLKPALARLSGELGISSRVYFTDGRGAVPDYLARMAVGCLSSRSEGLPNAILEYMASGLPVVATDVGGNAELVADGVTGYLVGERTPEAFAEPIVRLLRQEALRDGMGRKGLERARAEFDRGAAVGRLEDFYIDAVENARGRRRSTRPPSTVPSERKKAQVGSS
jgi:L-malate glycosyltransferase